MKTAAFLLGRALQRQKEKGWLASDRRRRISARDDLQRRLDAFDRYPLVSILLPVFNTNEDLLKRCLRSVKRQLYPNWELCIADDSSSLPHIRRILEQVGAEDKRIKVVFRHENGHISAASNSALELATGEFVVLLDHDDELSEDALYWAAKEIVENPHAGIIYSDEDLIDTRGRRFDVKFKPEFSRDLYYSLNLMTHLSAFRTDLVRSIGGFRLGFEGSQDYDLGLRVSELIDDDQIRHIPRVLYHWRVIPGSVALSPGEKPYAHDRARLAIKEHLERTGSSAEVLESSYQLHRVRYSVPNKPHLTVIASGSGDSLSTGNAEIIRVPDTSSHHAELLNDAVASSRSDVIIFIDENLRPLDEDAFNELARFATQSGIGVASGRILGPDLFVEECGLVLGGDLRPFPAHKDFTRDSPGNLCRNMLIGNFSAVSVSCMAIERSDFVELGGFDTQFETDFDVDLCLRLQEKGKRIVTVPQIEFVRKGPILKRDSSEAELALLRSRWPSFIDRDPFCNPNLKRDGRFSIDI